MDSATQNDARARLKVLEERWQDTVLKELGDLNEELVRHKIESLEKRALGDLACVKRVADAKVELTKELVKEVATIRVRCDTVRANDIDPLKESVTSLKVKMAIFGGLAGMIGGAVTGTIITLIITGALQ